MDLFILTDISKKYRKRSQKTKTTSNQHQIGPAINWQHQQQWASKILMPCPKRLNVSYIQKILIICILPKLDIKIRSDAKNITTDSLSAKEMLERRIPMIRK